MKYLHALLIASAVIDSASAKRGGKDSKKSSTDMTYCKTFDECKGDPMYKGGSCVFTTIVAGDINSQPADIRDGFEYQAKTGMGTCAPEMITKLFEKTPKTNMYDYHKWLFNNIPGDMKEEWFFKDWPKDAKRPGDFEGWVAGASQDPTWGPAIAQWRDLWFEAKIGDRDQNKGMDFEYCKGPEHCGPKYRGGACLNTKIVAGDPRGDDELVAMMAKQGNGGVCAPKEVLDYLNKVGMKTNFYDYYQAMWDTSPMMKTQFLMEWPKDAAVPGDFKTYYQIIAKMDQSGSVANWPNLWFQTTVLKGGKGKGKDMEQCMEFDDCPRNEMYRDGRCGKTQVVRGNLRDNQDMKKMLDMQGRGGWCTPGFIVDWMEDRDNRSSFYDYQDFLWDRMPEAKEMLMSEWPENAPVPNSFKEWWNMAKADKGVSQWRDIEFEMEWMEDGPRRGGRGGRRGGKMGGKMGGLPKGASMSIEMAENKDGESMIRIMMGANKLAATAATAAAAMYLY